MNHRVSSTTTNESTARQSAFQQVAAEILKQENDLIKAREQLKIDREKFDEEKNQMENLVENTDVIRLNVGGQIMMTTRETLTKVPKSILGMMFNSRWESKFQNDQEENVFFDFNPILFRHLLDQLQIFQKNNPNIFHPPFIPTLLEPFNKMLRKLGLNPSLSSEESVITLNVGGHTVTNRRKTFAQLSNSNFATSVSSFNTTKFNNNNSNGFLDHDPKLFQHLISQLREKIPSSVCFLKAPSHREHDAFKRIFNDFGVDEATRCVLNNVSNARWMQNGTTVAGGNGEGDELNQLSYPHGLYVNDDQTVYVADSSNHRIVEWKNGATSGHVVAGGRGEGNQSDQLNYPTDVIVDKKNDSLIICDYINSRVVRWPRRNGITGETIISNIDCYGLTMDNYGYLYAIDHIKNEVRRWMIGDRNGTMIAGANGEGERLDQLNGPDSLFVDQEHSVYVSDENNHRVMKWIEGAKEGIVVAGGQGEGNSLTQLHSPAGVVVDQVGTVYVAEYGNHRITRWPKGATQGSVVIGGNGASGEQANQFNGPWGLSFDRQGNLYVVDIYNHRVQKFNIDSSSNT